MSVLIHPGSDHDAWLAAFRAELPGVDFDLWPEVTDPDAVEYAVLSHHDADDLRRYPHLAAILAMGAGIEQFTTPDMPDVPIVRLVDQGMSDEMASYALAWTVHYQRRFDVFAEQQRASEWAPQPYVAAPDCPVGILGHGTIGRTVGELFLKAGYPVHAWSRTGGGDDGVVHHVGEAGLETFLGSVSVVVNVLPSTESTRGLLNAACFAQCRDGAMLINIGRGATVNEPDLIDALDSGPLSRAVLDVTATEPLPPTSPLWSHPRVTVTPHISGYTLVATASKVIAANLRRLMNGEDPYPLYERGRGY